MSTNSRTVPPHSSNGTRSPDQDSSHVTLPPTYKQKFMEEGRLDEIRHFQIGGGQRLSSRLPSEDERDLLEELEQLRRENETLQSQNDSRMASQLVEHSKSTRRLRNEKNKLKSTVRELTKENERLQKQRGRTELDPAREALRKELEETKEKLIKLQDLYEKVKNSSTVQEPKSVSKSAAERGIGDAGLEQKVEELTREIAKLKDEKAEVLRVNQQWDSQYDRMKAQLIERNDQLLRQIEILERKANRNDIVVDLEARLTAAQNEVDELKRRNESDVERAERRFRGEIEQLRVEVRELHDANGDWEAHFEKLKIGADKKEREMREYTENLHEQLDRALENQIDAEHGDVGRLRHQLTIKERDMAEIKEANRDLEGLLERKRRELEGVTAKWEHCRHLLQMEQEHTGDLQKDLLDLRKQANRGNVEDLRRRMQSLETQNDMLRTQVEGYEEDFQRERREKDEYLRKMREERDKAARLERQMRGSQADGSFRRDEIDEQVEAWRQFEQRRAAAAAADSGAYNLH